MENREETKRRVRFNIIDLTLILIVVALIAVPILRSTLSLRDGGSEKLGSYRVTLLCENIDGALAASLLPGDTLYLEDEALGKIGRADPVRATILYAGADGKPETALSDRAVDLTLSVTAEGTESEEGFLLGGKTRLAPGMTIRTGTGTVLLDALILEIAQA